MSIPGSAATDFDGRLLSPTGDLVMSIACNWRYFSMLSVMLQMVALWGRDLEYAKLRALG